MTEKKREEVNALFAQMKGARRRRRKSTNAGGDTTFIDSTIVICSDSALEQALKSVLDDEKPDPERQ